MSHAYSEREHVQQLSISKRGGMGHNRATVFDCHWKKGVMGRDTNLAFCSGINLLFFENYKRGLLRARSMALSKHVTQ